MTPKATTLLKVLLNRYHKGPLEEVFRYLPASDAESLKKNQNESQDLEAALAQPEDLIKMVHYSWLKPFLEKQSKNLIPLFLSCLPNEKAAKLSQSLQISPSPKVPIPLKFFLLQQINKSVFNQNLLLPPYLPESPLNSLVELSKPELLTLVDYFGLYDLADTIRQVVDKRVIKQLYSCLTPRKQEFLRQVLHQRERLVSTHINLEKWRGDCQEIKHTIHLRGLLRLGLALADQHPDLVWLVCHILDIGRAAVLTECLKKEKPQGVGPALTQQLIQLMKFLKLKS
jgi:hypothetical protein